MIKFAILLAVFGMSGLLGFEASKVYSSKTKFFEDLLDFTKNIKNEISFLKTDMLSLFLKYHYQSKLQEINSRIIAEQKDTEILNYEKIKAIITSEIELKEIEINTISKMYYELGKLNYLEQIERLEYYVNQFEAMRKNSVDKADKMMPFCKKIGFLIGSLICIVLI